MAQSIAVVNFLPDAGHVLPLLRIAGAFSARGYDVVCYLPPECEKYLEGYNFQFVSLDSAFSGTMKDNCNKTLFKLSKRSIFYNAFSNDVNLSESFWDPLRLIASRQFELAKSHLVEQQPVLLLSDEHVFDGLYVKLSKKLEIPLVLHTPECYRKHQSSYVKTYGISSLPRQSQAIVELLGNVSTRLFRLRTRIRRFIARGKTGKEAIEYIAPIVNSAEGEMSGEAYRQPIAISTGFSYLEQKHLHSELQICDEFRAFGPLWPKAALGLPWELREWLEENNESVVYVSFGSMIRLDVGLVKAILGGLALLNVRVLWSMPKAQQEELLPKIQVPASVRFRDFVPPLEVLSMPSVRCGINHGGAGSIQDCLLSGTPMLCIPFMWDQPFNSSVVSHLNVGRRLWRQRASAKAIAASVKRLLNDKQIRLRSTNLATELRHSNSEEDVVEYILNHPLVLTTYGENRHDDYKGDAGLEHTLLSFASCRDTKEHARNKITSKHLFPPLTKGVRGTLKSKVAQVISCTFLK